jgi:hypothetical protein
VKAAHRQGLADNNPAFTNLDDYFHNTDDYKPLMMINSILVIIIF